MTTGRLFGCASLYDCGWTGPQVGRNKEGTEFCPNCGGFVAERDGSLEHDWHPCRDVDGATCADQDECENGCIRIIPHGAQS